MTRPRYAINTPPPMMQNRPGPLSQLGSMAANKALSAGINAAVPGGGFAAEAAQQVLPGVLGLQGGGKVDDRFEAEIAALEELFTPQFVSPQAVRPAKSAGTAAPVVPVGRWNYKEEGGEVKDRSGGRGGATSRALKKAWKWWTGGDDNSTAEHKNEGGWLDYIWENEGRGGRPAPAAQDSGSGGVLDYIWGKGRAGEAARRNMQEFRPRQGSAAYRQSGGDVHGPMHDDMKADMKAHSHHMINEINKAKKGPLSAVTYKMSGGDVTHEVKRDYHNPLMSKPSAK